MKKLEELTIEELRDFRNATFTVIDTVNNNLLEEHLRDLYETLLTETTKRRY
ncbi:hypothetical protein ACWXWV_00310 [Bacillus paranthracis]|uniref:hypothetical protein n=1 Tax=Bacillus cereus group TaxID=86661 RepID=UPI0022364EF1|nr:hypothetical protein [Bacillus pacificus]